MKGARDDDAADRVVRLVGEGESISAAADLDVLYTAIDPDALDDIFRADVGRIVFPLLGESDRRGTRPTDGRDAFGATR